MDKRSLIGFFLMMAMAAGFFWYSNYETKKYNEQLTADSLAQAMKNPPVPIGNKISDSGAVDTTFPPALQSAPRQLVTLNNKKLTIKFSTKGGTPHTVILDSFKTYHGKQLLFAEGDTNKLSLKIPLNGKTIETQNLTFTPSLTNTNDGGQQLTMTADLGNGKSIVYAYSLPPNSYMMQASIHLRGMQAELAGLTSVPLTWTTQALPTEKDIKNERLNTQVHYLFKDNEHDYFTLQRTPNETLDKPVKWFAVKTHFFNSTLIADNEFSRGSFSGQINENDSSEILVNTTKLSIPIQNSNDIAFNYKWMISPNDYYYLKSHNMQFDEMIQLGFGVFFFVKYISKWLVIPLFTFLNNNIASVGIAIMLLTLIIRFFLSFFTYKSYKSSAKMRVLKPQIDKLREKYEGDQQQIGLEQMKLYRNAGVNPLGGCLPMLLQMPFLLSMYYFFPTSLDLRQQKFLWAEDLSTYDQIASWTQNIPILSSVYGNHISLFTLLMAITSILVAVYNRNMTPTAGGANDINMKMMKWMPFIMPIMFLGWFNSFAAGLTFYYTFSNILSMGQQWVIQKFFINEEAILARIHKKQSEPKKQSKWQQRLEEMQKMQQQQMQQKNKK